MNKTCMMLFVILLIALLVASAVAVWLLIPHESKLRVACVGDSITEGSLYVKDLTELLGRNYSVGNFGVGLASVSLATAKPYMNQTVFEQAKNFQPQKVVIMLGTNDAITWYQNQIGNFTEDYKHLIGEFQALPSQPQVFLVVPPPILDDSLGPNSTILQEQIILQICQIAAETGLPLIDFYNEMSTHPEYFSDGVHITKEGSEFVAEKIFESIKS